MPDLNSQRAKESHLPGLLLYWLSKEDLRGTVSTRRNRFFLAHELAQTVIAPPSDLDLSNVEDRFARLLYRWMEETAFCSFIIDIVNNEAYRELVALGDAAVPLFLAIVEEHPLYATIALEEITKANPVPIEHLGDMDAMAQDWLKWGREHRYKR